MYHIGDEILLDSVCLTNLTIDRNEHVYLYTKPIDGFLHIAAMDDGGKIITLSDGSIWSIGWLRALLISSNWQIGQNILITKYSNDLYGLANLTIRAFSACHNSGLQPEILMYARPRVAGLQPINPRLLYSRPLA